LTRTTSKTREFVSFFVKVAALVRLATVFVASVLIVSPVIDSRPEFVTVFGEAVWLRNESPTVVLAVNIASVFAVPEPPIVPPPEPQAAPAVVIFPFASNLAQSLVAGAEPA